MSCSPTDICGPVDPQAHSHPVEGNSQPWSFEPCVRGARPPNTRKMVTCTMANSIIIATTVDANSSSAVSHTVSRTTSAVLSIGYCSERLSLQGICRAVGVTLKWLLGILVQCFEALPDPLPVQPVSWSAARARGVQGPSSTCR